MKIKEILPEHVGRKVKQLPWGITYIVIAVEGEYVWLKEGDGSLATYMRTADWELKDLPAPKKTARERIREIQASKAKSPFMQSTLQEVLEAVIDYLDEVEEGK